MKKLKRTTFEEYNLLPFITKEGLTEVWLLDETWGCNIHLVTNIPSHKAMQDWMTRVFNIKDNSASDKYIENKFWVGEAISIAYANSPGLKAMVIRIPEKWKENLENILTLSHEALHCTFKILSRKGMRHSEETEEAYTYFHESIVRRLVEAMRKPVLPYEMSISDYNKKYYLQNSCQIKKKR